MQLCIFVHGNIYIGHRTQVQTSNALFFQPKENSLVSLDHVCQLQPGVTDFPWEQVCQVLTASEWLTEN